MSDLIRSPVARRQAIAQIRAGWLAAGQLLAYTAPVPSEESAITTQTLLAAYPFPQTLTVQNGVITTTAMVTALNLASGPVGFCRAVDSNGECVFDADVGLIDSGAAVEFEVLTLVAGSLSTPVSFTLTEG